MLKAAAATAGVAAWLTGCEAPPAPLHGRWLGAGHERGHRLRGTAPDAAQVASALPRRAQVVIVGAGVAGLAAARAYMRRGVDDVRVLELEDAAGGNARGHTLGGMACPLGAHYLPVPGPHAHEVRDWLFELGLLKSVAGRTVAEERHLCHSPQERLFMNGAWHEGLLPPHEDRPATLAAYRGFASALAEVLAKAGADAFALPSQRARHGAVQQALDKQAFAQWLDGQGLTDERLRWYLDYCCRDDYGAGADVVSAWAGLHYFASRHGFAAPGEGDASRDGVFTWPEGNAWLTQRLAAPLGERLLTGRVVQRVSASRHEVQLLAWDANAKRFEAWTAQTVVMALPIFVAARVLEVADATLSSALTSVAATLRHAPWLVANLQLDRLPLDRPGAAPAWDSVVYGAAGLGYVDAMHQSLRAAPGATVLTAYHAWPVARRAELLAMPWQAAAEHVLADLQSTHPDLRRRVQRLELIRHGHAMAVPTPGVREMATSGALAALRAQRGRVRFAHADLAGFSVFEEAFTLGCQVAL